MPKKVKNLRTGIIHTVNDGHWSLASPEFDEMKPAKKRPVQKKKAKD